MPVLETKGAISAQGFGLTLQQGEVNYIEDVFSTWLYNGNGGSNTIINGIDLAGKGGLIWTKSRSDTGNNWFVDTARGINFGLYSNDIAAQFSDPGTFTSFNSTGYSMNNTYGDLNSSGRTYVSWTLREQPKFFDVVTWSGNGVVGRQIPHNLGSVPGCIIVKRTSLTGGWFVYHRSLGASQAIRLEETGAAGGTAVWNSTSPTSTVFTVNDSTAVNASGSNYVAYIFAHDAGGFGLTGTDNVITCGSYVGNGVSAGPIVSLGYEPQWLLIKNASGENTWTLYDNMRGMAVSGSNDRVLQPNVIDAEFSVDYVAPLATGFQIVTNAPNVNSSGSTYIYIAIRRGPMKVPTTGTSVFSPNTATDTEGQGVVKTTNFPVDLQITKSRESSGQNWTVDRLRGVSTNTTDSGRTLITNSTDAESTSFAVTRYWNNTGFQISGAIGNSSQVYWNFRRAPGFFDEVCYTEVGGTSTVTHNLGVAPELLIFKSRSQTSNWGVYAAPLGTSLGLRLNADAQAINYGFTPAGAPTSTTFTVANFAGGGNTTVAYLFASCPGVSRVGLVTHVEPTTVVCGFTPRFIVIKSTTITGTDDWFVFDSARGLVPANDPYLRFNSSGAENTPFGPADLVDVTATGFIMNGFNGGNYIFLAIA
jgi:hypothetical protein